MTNWYESELVDVRNPAEASVALVFIKQQNRIVILLQFKLNEPPLLVVDISLNVEYEISVVDPELDISIPSPFPELEILLNKHLVTMADVEVIVSLVLNVWYS